MDASTGHAVDAGGAAMEGTTKSLHVTTSLGWLVLFQLSNSKPYPPSPASFHSTQNVTESKPEPLFTTASMCVVTSHS